jgi:hypothetical protein
LLDGNGDGTAGDDFTAVFTVAEPVGNAVLVGAPDFVRGPGQAIDVPASAAVGIPITISDGTNVRTVALRVRYNPSLMDITAANVAPGMPMGATVTVDRATPGIVSVTFVSPTNLAPGSNHIMSLEAAVPADAAGDSYHRSEVLDFHAVSIQDGSGDELPIVVDDAIHFAVFFADVSGNNRINASDASLIARFAALLDPGFAASLTIDPHLLADITGNGLVNAADAARVAMFAALIPVPEIPPIPAGIATLEGGATATVSGQSAGLTVKSRESTDAKQERTRALTPRRGLLPSRFSFADGRCSRKALLLVEDLLLECAHLGSCRRVV